MDVSEGEQMIHRNRRDRRRIRKLTMDKNGYKEIVAQQMAEISELKEKFTQ